jgi:hypothetical protein
MKHPPLFDKMLDVWMAWPRIIEGAIQDGAASHEPHPGWLPVRDRSTVGELLPPTAYAVPGAAEAFNKELRRLHRRIKLSAFLSGMSRDFRSSPILRFTRNYSRPSQNMLLHKRPLTKYRMPRIPDRSDSENLEAEPQLVMPPTASPIETGLHEALHIVVARLDGLDIANVVDHEDRVLTSLVEPQRFTAAALMAPEVFMTLNNIAFTDHSVSSEMRLRNVSSQKR